jgi:hypothetical protein
VYSSGKSISIAPVESVHRLLTFCKAAHAGSAGAGCQPLPISLVTIIIGISGTLMAYKHFRHAWQAHTFLFWREGWEIDSPSPRYTTWSNWVLIETLDSIEQMPEPCRTQVRRRGACIYQRAPSNEPASQEWSPAHYQTTRRRSISEQLIDAFARLGVPDFVLQSARQRWPRRLWGRRHIG